jgi:hypothetical protein
VTLDQKLLCFQLSFEAQREALYVTSERRVVHRALIVRGRLAWVPLSIVPRRANVRHGTGLGCNWIHFLFFFSFLYTKPPPKKTPLPVPFIKQLNKKTKKMK